MMNRSFRSGLMLLAFLSLVAIPLSAVGRVDATEPVSPVATGAKLFWPVAGEHGGATLTVSRPDGEVARFEFKRNETPTFGPDENTVLPDGEYRYEIVIAPTQSRVRTNQTDTTSAEGNDDAGSRTISGNFRVVGGAILVPSAGAGENAGTGGGGLVASPEDVVYADDLIVQFSACIGNDCVNGENFGFDTLRLKENNLRIHFDDTSNSGSFPSNDWRIVANDSTNGGASYLSIEDSTAGRTPLTVTAGAKANALYIANGGKVGFNTSTPAVELHVADGDSPTLRLEQNGSSGFTAQTWDIVGNEANFFVRDVTNGSKLSFRIRPGAPESSIDIAASGNVGFGTASPDARIDVEKSGGSAGFENLLILRRTSGGPPGMLLADNFNDHYWEFRMTSGGNFRISDTDTTGANDDGTTEFDLGTTGNLTIGGTLSQGSSREWKKDLEPVDSSVALNGVRSLPIFAWTYKNDVEGARHIGPTAEEFHAAFGLGSDEKHIAPGDQAGLALAAIKQLASMVDEKDRKIQDLESRLEELERLVKQNNQ